MKATTAMKLVEKFGKKGTNAFSLVMKALEDGSNTIRPCWVRGRGRYIQNANYTSDVLGLLQRAGIRYTFGNDAPRGGLAGNLIILTHIH